MKKLMSLLLASSLLLSVLAGCSNSNDDAGGADDGAGDVTTPSKSIYEMSETELIEAAKAAGPVTFSIWHQDALWNQIGDAFTEEYGVEFELVFGDKATTTAKVITEKDSEKGTIDLMAVGGEDVKTTIDAGVFMDGTLESVEHKDTLDPGMSVRIEGVEHGGALVPIYRNQTGLLYNPDVVTDPPQTWAELEAWIAANPKEFGFCDPSKGGSGQAMMLASVDHVAGGLDRYVGDTEIEEADVANWDEVWAWYNERKDLVTVTASNKDSLSRLNSGELSLVVAWDDQTTATKAAGELFKNATLYIPEFGLPGGGDAAGILKNAKNPAGALLLLNYLTGDDAQNMINETLGSYPARDDIEVTVTSINPEDLVNRTDWVPAQYKKKFIDDFVTNVLMQG